MKPIRLRVTLFPQYADDKTLRTRNFVGDFVITNDDDRIEIRAESEPGSMRDTTAFLGSIIKLDVESAP
jgi:hypothetical protein